MTRDTPPLAAKLAAYCIVLYVLVASVVIGVLAATTDWSVVCQAIQEGL